MTGLYPSCSGEKTLRSSRNHVEADYVIDVPESLTPKTQRSSMHKKDNKWSISNVICIDDEEIQETSHSFSAKGLDFSVGATSNAESCRNESRFGQDAMPPVRLSNCKFRYSGKCFTRNSHRLDTDYESDSWDSDCLDCELVEDSLGKIQEQWDKAFSRRKRNMAGQRNEALASSSTGETLPFSGLCIISDREKLKETDEYKRAMEEEWASRRRALQIQAEEAKRLKRLKRRRVAESMRLLAMERRQKERIEEVRNIQRKDEESMNLKEKLRAEVRTELTELEVSCHDMASLLHSLSIHVGGWPNPLPQEVQKSYKRALLTFHPDRNVGSDIRQQVEAEEKFKLINRLKEKF